jgi:hypothetical protein
VAVAVASLPGEHKLRAAGVDHPDLSGGRLRSGGRGAFDDAENDQERGRVQVACEPVEDAAVPGAKLDALEHLTQQRLALIECDERLAGFPLVGAVRRGSLAHVASPPLARTARRFCCVQAR